MSEPESSRPPIAAAALSVLLVADHDRPIAREVLETWQAYLDQLGREYEILVAREGTDIPADEYPRLRLLKTDGEPGIGAALRAGLPAARHPLLVCASGDAAYRADDLKRLLERIDIADLVVGCRAHPTPAGLRWAGRLYRAAARVLIGVPLTPLPTWLGWKNWLFHRLLRVLSGVRLHDVNCGLQLFRRAAVATIPIQSAGPFARAELLAKANFLGCLMDEVPITGPAEEGPLRPLLREGYRVMRHAEFVRRR